LEAFLASDAGQGYEIKAYAPKDPIFGNGVGAIYYALTILSNILIARIDARVRRWMPRGAS
ncbi:MAG: hypothetical protein ACK56F_16150, partial [bacterium]